MDADLGVARGSGLLLLAETGGGGGEPRLGVGVRLFFRDGGGEAEAGVYELEAPGSGLEKGEPLGGDFRIWLGKRGRGGFLLARPDVPRRGGGEVCVVDGFGPVFVDDFGPVLVDV